MTSPHLQYDEPVLRYHRIVAELTAEVAPIGGRVLDVGCGPGQILGQLQALRNDLELVGIDGDEECLRRAARRCPTATLIQGDLERPGPAEDAGRRFDVVVSSHSLEHLADPVGALAYWRALLAAEGKLVVAVPNSLQPLLMTRAVLRRPKANDGHYYIWDRATFENFCRLAGFQIIDRRQDYVPLTTVRLRQRLPAIAGLERALLRPLPQFSNSHIVVMEPGGGPTREPVAAGQHPVPGGRR